MTRHDSNAPYLTRFIKHPIITDEQWQGAQRILRMPDWVRLALDNSLELFKAQDDLIRAQTSTDELRKKVAGHFRAIGQVIDRWHELCQIKDYQAALEGLFRENITNAIYDKFPTPAQAAIDGKLQKAFLDGLAAGRQISQVVLDNMHRQPGGFPHTHRRVLVREILTIGHVVHQEVPIKYTAEKAPAELQAYVEHICKVADPQAFSTSGKLSERKAWAGTVRTAMRKFSAEVSKVGLKPELMPFHLKLFMNAHERFIRDQQQQ